MKTTTTMIALLIATAAIAAPTDYQLELEYRGIEPTTGGNSGYEFSLSANGRYDMGSYDLGLDIEHIIGEGESNSLMALHLGRDFGAYRAGAVLGASTGHIDAVFYGVEGGYQGSKFSFDARYTMWEMDNFDENFRVDAIAAYQINDKWSVFYDYTHNNYDGGDFKMDDYLAGVKYNINDSTQIKLGYGELHPKNTATGYNNVWSQFALSVSMFYDDPGAHIDPIDAPTMMIGY